METFLVALRATLVTLVLTGVAYPLVVTGLAQVVFPSRANGSIVTDDRGREVGSSLIGQGFARPAYLWPRPSASGYDGANSAGTNLGTTSKKLREGQADDPATKDVDESFTGIIQLVKDYQTANELPATTVLPPDAVTRSASGIDPDVSPENAHLQAARIAKARGVEVARVEAVIDANLEGRALGLLGEPRVNVLAVNLALDRKFGRPEPLAGDGGATLPK
jgi:K+-transporting ATPase ATPase C chain